jgi:NADPH-dependent 2,4-dienoyl-CoA reductase/sulfur reductase-like enzyme
MTCFTASSGKPRLEIQRMTERLLVIGGDAVGMSPDLSGSNARGIYGLSVLEDGIRVRRAVDQDQRGCAVVVGGGYIGLEMAEALLMRGLHVSLVDHGRAVRHSIWSVVDPSILPSAPSPTNRAASAASIWPEAMRFSPA